jgi:hypothetical protein
VALEQIVGLKDIRLIHELRTFVACDRIRASSHATTTESPVVLAPPSVAHAFRGAGPILFLSIFVIVVRSPHVRRARQLGVFAVGFESLTLVPFSDRI